MAKSLKTNGLAELRSLIKRVDRQYALRRIGKTDHDILLDLLHQAESRIVKMAEKQEEEEESWRL